MAGDSPRCLGTRRDGQPCAAPVVGADGFCRAHSPSRRDQFRAQSVAGGHGKAKVVRLSKRLPPSLKPVLAVILDALGEVHRGELDPPIANSMAALAGAAVRLFQAAELEQRLEDIEAKLRIVR
jgi:hypothetical protein